ncbi:MAG: EAL and HDOD domain-containing protein, partial [Sarcina sp.]
MDIYLARQSIYDINENVIAYEILFRDTLDNRYILDEKIDPTKILLSNMNAIGIKRISNNKKIFVNFDKANIYNDLAYTLEKKIFIIEILESVEITDKLIKKLRCLKLAGYIIAFDDYTIKKNIDKILEYI